MSEAMDAEFDTVAEWTAQVAAELGFDYHIPAACRGSGSPAALEWLIDELRLSPGHSLLDCGAGVGGPAAYAAQRASVRPVLVEPEAGACRAALRLFGFPVVQAVASALPLTDACVDAAWSLGVLCTTPDQLALLTELRRAVRPGGRIGLIVFVARGPLPANQPEGNYFPTPAELAELVETAGLTVEQWQGTADLPAIPQQWNDRAESVENALAERYGGTRAWQLAERQSRRIAELLQQQTVTGEMLVLLRG